jgi:AcrR family transcriptional regulator
MVPFVKHLCLSNGMNGDDSMATKPAVQRATRPPTVTIDADASVGAPRAVRADAVKNRQRILEAAEATFASEGLAVPVDTVAERAGVGVGTLYRHFPTKEALFEAIVMTRLEDLVAEAASAADAEDPTAALFAFLRHFASQASAKHDLFDAMGAAGFDIKSQCAETVDDMKRAVDRLVARVKAAGDIRSDVGSEEILGLIMGTCQAAQNSGLDDAASQRMIDIVCDGIKAPGR